MKRGGGGRQGWDRGWAGEEVGWKRRRWRGEGKFSLEVFVSALPTHR